MTIDNNDCYWFNCSPMGNYTLEIGQLLARGYKIFDFDYPFYDESHRAEFERKFLLHFRYHEIGQETLQRFKYMLQDTLTLEHEKYLHYYKAKVEADKLKWWNNKDYHTSTTRVLDTTDHSTSINDSSTEANAGVNSTSTDVTDFTDKFLDTPQGEITNLDKYLTTVTVDRTEEAITSEDNSSSQSHTGSSGETSKVGKDTETIKTDEYGNIGVTTAGSIVKSWLKDAYINVDKMIFKDCENLFMQVY